jgi:hypothetical protein
VSPAAGEVKLRLSLRGVRPMILHNGRLANPLDPHTRAVAAIARKRNKTDTDHAELAAIEARGGMYETSDGRLGLPTENVWRCLYDAAKAYKLGEAVKQALLDPADVVPLTIPGLGTPQCDEYLRRREGLLLYVPVVVQRRRVMRARPLVPAGWSATVDFTLLTDVLQPERLGPVFDRAARLVGLGDWRPRYGLFEVHAEVL